jgi:hypothetical protein
LRSSAHSRPQKCRPLEPLQMMRWPRTTIAMVAIAIADMKKRYGNRQNMMEVFVAFAVPQLFLGLMFKRLTFGEKLLFILA